MLSVYYGKLEKIIKCQVKLFFQNLFLNAQVNNNHFLTEKHNLHFSFAKDRQK